MKKVIIPLFIIALTAAFLFGCRNDEPAPQTTQAIPVKTTPVIKKKFVHKIHSSGVLASKKEVKLAFKTGGVIASINVEEGQQVKKGQLLASLDLAEIEARRKQAKSGLQKAERDFERVQQLYKDSVATYEQFQNTETALEMARSNLEIADFNLKHSKILAPADGRILKRFMDENELTGPGNPIIIFGSTENEWIVRMGVTDKDILRLKIGDKAEIAFDAYPGIRFSALVSEIAAAANPMTGTYEVELQLKPASHTLLSGFVGKVEITPSVSEELSLIPVQALTEGKGKSGYVYHLNKNKNEVIKQKVEIAYILQDVIAIRSGIENISRVVSEGAPYLSDGAQVKVLN